MKDTYFIGTFIPERLFHSVEKISFAGINYQKKVIKAYRINQVFGLMPLNVPTQRKIFFYENGIGYIHYKIFNSKILKLLLDQLAVYRKIKQKSVVVFYNVTIQNFLLIYALTKIKKCCCYSIVADYDDYRNHTGSGRLLHKVINMTFKSLKGAIVLNRNIQTPTKSVVLEGIIDPEDLPPFITEVIKNRILFSGSVGYTTGIHIAIKAMDYLPDFELIITGPPFDLEKKDIDDLISEAKYSNISYLGSLDKEKYQELLLTSNITLSLRDNSKVEHQHNFPSKILEYLSYNKRVISTINYECVSDYLTISEFDAVSVAHTIQNLSLTDSFNAKYYIINRFGLPKFRETLEQLIKSTSNAS